MSLKKPVVAWRLIFSPEEWVSHQTGQQLGMGACQACPPHSPPFLFVCAERYVAAHAKLGAPQGEGGQLRRPAVSHLPLYYQADASGEAAIESDGITPLSWHRGVAEAHRVLGLLKIKKEISIFWESLEEDDFLLCSNNTMVCVLIDLCSINIFKTYFLIKMGWNKFPSSEIPSWIEPECTSGFLSQPELKH